MFAFNHVCFNVLDLQKSMDFYAEAFGLHEVRRHIPEDNSFILVFLGDGHTDFSLELTWLRDRTEPYDLGECEYHLALATDDMAAALEKHKKMGCVCFENPDMGIYFVNDPDGYWIEVIPAKK